MTNKALEMDLKQIMQGLEEFATFMSFQSNYEGLRILKVETHEPNQPNRNSIPDNVVRLNKARPPHSRCANETRAKKYR